MSNSSLGSFSTSSTAGEVHPRLAADAGRRPPRALRRTSSSSFSRPLLRAPLRTPDAAASAPASRSSGTVALAASWRRRRRASSSRRSGSGRTCGRGSGRRRPSGPACRASTTSIRSSMMSWRDVEEPPAEGEEAHRRQRRWSTSFHAPSGGELVGGELLHQELVVRQVVVERADDPVAVGVGVDEVGSSGRRRSPWCRRSGRRRASGGPSARRSAGRRAGGRPPSRTASGGVVGDERLDLLRRRRQAGQVEGRAADQACAGRPRATGDNPFASSLARTNASTGVRTQAASWTSGRRSFTGWNAQNCFGSGRAAAAVADAAARPRVGAPRSHPRDKSRDLRSVSCSFGGIWRSSSL